MQLLRCNDACSFFTLDKLDMVPRVVAVYCRDLGFSISQCMLNNDASVISAKGTLCSEDNIQQDLYFYEFD